MKKFTILSMGVACGLSLASSLTFAKDELTIWMPFDKGAKGMTYVVDKFEKDTGIKVTVAYPESLEQRFPQVASTGNGPDIMIFAHDRFGGYAEAGLISEVTPSKEYQDKFEGFMWDATFYKGKQYGYPIAAETVSLIYNKDIIDEPLKNWQDIFVLDKKLSKINKKAIAWAIKTPYFTHPLFSSAGAYVFETTAKGYNPNKVGVNTPEAKQTMNFLKKIVDTGVMPADMDYSHAESAFVKGEVAMTVNGPWSWVNMDKMGVNYAVVELPKFEGKPSRPFVGVLMAGVNSASKNHEVAVEFIENYLLSYDSLKYMNNQVPIGVPALKKLSVELVHDPRLKASLINARNGDIMPNIPQMMSYWGGLDAAVSNVLDGRQTVDEALDTLEKRIVDKK